MRAGFVFRTQPGIGQGGGRRTRIVRLPAHATGHFFFLVLVLVVDGLGIGALGRVAGEGVISLLGHSLLASGVRMVVSAGGGKVSGIFGRGGSRGDHFARGGGLGV